MQFRKAETGDLNAIERIYEEILSMEERGESSIGWIRGVYPTRQTAELALERGDLFVAVCGEDVIGCAVINQQQVDVYEHADWNDPAEPKEVMVLHTLVIAPAEAGKGRGKDFVAFYEHYARQNNCPYLRMDTNARNARARTLYKKLGYREIGIVPCVFNGIPDVKLVLLEKNLNNP